MDNIEKIKLFKKLNAFIKKYYTNQLIKGIIYLIAMLSIFFIVFSTLEYFSRFNVQNRTILFWSYIIINLLIALKYILIPLLNLFRLGNTLTHKQAACIIGDHFSEINDTLLNILQLEEIGDTKNALINASIKQKTDSIKPISFNKAINLFDNKKYLKWILFPCIIIFIFMISGKEYILTESSARIINHNTFFEPKAPFQYHIINKKLEAIQYNDFTLKVRVTGNQIPSEIFIVQGKNRFKLMPLKNNEFTYNFKNISSDISFSFSAGGYKSLSYIIKAIPQPKVIHLKTTIRPPKHTGQDIRQKISTGDLIVPEGSNISWEITLQNTDECLFIVNKSIIGRTTKNKMEINKQIYNSSRYLIISKNANLTDTLAYFIKVINDKPAEISIKKVQDSTYHNFVFEGNIKDDYGTTKLNFICENDSNIIVKSINIPIDNAVEQNIFFSYDFKDLNLNSGQEVYFYFKVWDNDYVNGPKPTKSQTFQYKKPSTEELIEKKDLGNQETKKSFEKSILMSKKIEAEIKKLNKKILEKQNLGWEEKQNIKDILKKQRELEQQIKNTQNKNKNNLNNQKELNSNVIKKQEELEKLIDSILNKETKKILEEMKKIIDNPKKEKLKELLEKLDEENNNIETELERELELFKQIEFEQKTEEILNQIQKIKEDQKNLLKKTDNKKQNKSDLENKQEKIKKQTEKMNSELDKLKEKNNDLENKKNIPDTKNNQEEIQQHMQESKSSLQKNQNKKSSKSQKKALEKLEDLKKQIESIQTNNNIQAIEDMEMLRGILENLITLSFEQEKLMIKTSRTSNNSSEFIKIAQNQNKLNDDSKIIKDSLIALSKRVVQIKAIINQEISSINNQMKKTKYELEKRASKKAAERQQFVMTSANNLALMLSEILEQMQKDLDMSSNCDKPKNCNKPNPNCNKPSMSQIREAQKKINKKMQKQGKKGKGEKTSKELIELARKQEEIRNQLLELRNDIGENGKKGEIDRVIENMENNEQDIINDQITQETLDRQEEILTRLLDAESAKREQDQDINRLSNEWHLKLEEDNIKYIQYKKKKKNEEELLKTTPVNFNQFYKNKVKNYFKNAIND